MNASEIFQKRIKLTLILRRVSQAFSSATPRSFRRNAQWWFIWKKMQKFYNSANEFDLKQSTLWVIPVRDSFGARLGIHSVARPVLPSMEEVNIDTLLEKLLEVRGSRPGKQVNLAEHEIRWLCTKARDLFIAQPNLLELEAPIKIVGM